MSDGILRNSDLRLDHSRYNATGVGQVDIGQQRIDYTIMPSVSGDLLGRTLVVPVRIRGPWSKLVILPDFESAIGDIAVNELSKQLGLTEYVTQAVVAEQPATIEDVLRNEIERELGKSLGNSLGKLFGT